jgi:uncharacterized spore protein YtfJ
MGEALTSQWPMTEQDKRISEAIAREESRLRHFIRERVAEPRDVEDILQDVLYELVEAYRMMKPVEQVTAWLFRVARNRITDLFRKRSFGEPISAQGKTIIPVARIMYGYGAGAGSGGMGDTSARGEGGGGGGGVRAVPVGVIVGVIEVSNQQTLKVSGLFV